MREQEKREREYERKKRGDIQSIVELFHNIIEGFTTICTYRYVFCHKIQRNKNKNFLRNAIHIH